MYLDSEMLPLHNFPPCSPSLPRRKLFNRNQLQQGDRERNSSQKITLSQRKAGILGQMKLHGKEGKQSKPRWFGRAAFWCGAALPEGPLEMLAEQWSFVSPKPQVSMKHSRSYSHLSSACPDIFPLKSKFCSHFPISQSQLEVFF